MLAKTLVTISLLIATVVTGPFVRQPVSERTHRQLALGMHVENAFFNIFHVNYESQPVG